ncbi:conserved hypothetical protein [Ricinus communis]|uniref:Uncharacterized protein n=1 Tax=Ricinus communis TaxID=3988 RepID=B9RZ81_RICCO|nr:conserved hypothetical protein [Ricinus communis]
MAIKWVCLALFASLILGLCSAHTNFISNKVRSGLEIHAHIRRDGEPEPPDNVRSDAGTVVARASDSTKATRETSFDGEIIDDPGVGGVSSGGACFGGDCDNRPKAPPLPPPCPDPNIGHGNRRKDEEDVLYNDYVINQLTLAIQQLTQVINGKVSSSSPPEGSNEPYGN